MTRPDWMLDPSISHIPQEKLDFLSAMFEKVKSKNPKELMPFFMAMSGKLKGKISFTSEEIQLIVAAIKRSSSSEEQKQLDQILDAAARKMQK